MNGSHQENYDRQSGLTNRRLEGHVRLQEYDFGGKLRNGSVSSKSQMLQHSPVTFVA